MEHLNIYKLISHQPLCVPASIVPATDTYMARQETRSSNVTRTSPPFLHLLVKPGLTMVTAVAGVNLLKGLELRQWNSHREVCLPMTGTATAWPLSDSSPRCVPYYGLKDAGNYVSGHSQQNGTTLVYHIRQRTRWDSSSDPIYFQTAFIAMCYTHVYFTRSFILQSVLRRVHFLFQRELSTKCDLGIPLSISSNLYFL
jgi:hypothetical protein